ncbi:MAG: hypothetical protein GFH27_549283n172 [Chloroflexi bacterium AL-W]|nr:hypothetical protein [Chloroflexi bacterium AL-N1]NOK64707.1 hypothetical protein [Chloroflexi bacterium AL-N10]NOK75948.1 hypothetical protein [Chloroflexi bacterium AL-N5]NOK80293.1 hypothetical protein [Chloroflexi bacterium AL-W]NOK86806.1 hypothetical protein [Chloroflexi bacterium AL-N15]
MTDEHPYLRNTPRQLRSRERFHRILDHANQLFAQEGYDNVTTNHIAEAADVTIGSLYHFFPNKEAILQALVDRYRERLTAVFPQDVAPPHRIPDLLTKMLDNIMAFQEKQAGLDWMLTMTGNTSYQESIYALHDQIVAWVEGMLGEQFPALDETQRQLCALSGVAIIKGMLSLAHPPAAVSVETFKTEAHTALIGYLTQFLRQRGIQTDLN